tara:strand:- start:55 stop:588 length:534 start_codon:yes stop_codon:yes gene_type:complete
MIILPEQQPPSASLIAAMGGDNAAMLQQSDEEDVTAYHDHDHDNHDADVPRFASTNVEATDFVDGTLPSMKKKNMMMIVMKEKEKKKAVAQSTTLEGNSMPPGLSEDVWLRCPRIAWRRVTSVVGEEDDFQYCAKYPPLDYQEDGEKPYATTTWKIIVPNPDDEAHATVSSNVFNNI